MKHIDLPPHWKMAHAPAVVSGAPPAGSVWAVDSVSGAATSICTSEAEAIQKAHDLQARLDRMLADMERRKAA